MSYVPTGLFSPEHREALTVTPGELRSLSVQERADYLLRIKQAKEARWEVVATVLTGMIPVITFLGVERLFRR